MTTIRIDGKEYRVQDNKNLLETILSLGLDLPYFCWHPALGSVGSCRQCAVTKYKNEEDNQGQIVMACMEPVIEGQSISIEDKAASDFRKHVIEWLMVNHPHDCPICDEGGECHLQDMTLMTGHNYRRSRFKKRTHNNQHLGPCINHEMNRCIQCYRCVRFYNDYAGGDDLQVFAAHDHVYFGRHEDGTLESEFSGNLVEVCPTGVFTDKTLKDHYTRKWDLTSAPSVCNQCSLGCNILVGERYGSTRRVLSRFNQQVNGYFICDRGRFGYDFLNSEERILKSGVSNGHWKMLEKSEINERLSKVVGSGNLMGIGSPRASLESNYALRTLVGKENFYNGIGRNENQLLQLALEFLNKGPVKTPSLKEIENYDAVIVIGEDVTNTAPMIDLALNQSVRVKPLKEIDKIGIPDWNDAAAREYIQQKKGPLYILTPQQTKLDRISTKCFREGPEELTRLVMSLGNLLDNSLPADSQSKYEVGSIREIADALVEAERPLVVTGTSLGNANLMKAAINLATALHQRNKEVGISFVFPESNSVGVGMMEEKSLGEALISEDNHTTLVILENDLFRRQASGRIEKFLERFENVVVLDHSKTATADKANLLLAAATFAETDGTLVNNEGRAQRFFQVQAVDENVMSSWQWISQAKNCLENNPGDNISEFDYLVNKIESDLSQYQGISKAAPPSGFRINGQKISRAPHRYSGRTAMFANHSVNEPRPPEDEDSPLSFTMEGFRGVPPASATSFYWSPGWNSAQAINKFRNEVVDGNKSGDYGIRLIEPSEVKEYGYQDIKWNDSSSDWTIVPIHQIFGTEEWSMKSQAIVDRSIRSSITISEENVREMNIGPGDEVTILVDDIELVLAARIVSGWPSGHLGISVGYPGQPFIDRFSVVRFKKPTNP